MPEVTVEGERVAMPFARWRCVTNELTDHGPDWFQAEQQRTGIAVKSVTLRGLGRRSAQ